MKILHLPETCLPWKTGGKEVYTQTLVKALEARGIQNHVAIHSNSCPDVKLGTYYFEGSSIHVLPPLPDYGSRRSSYEKTYVHLPGFDDLLRDLNPDVIHFHDQGGGASLSHLKAAKTSKIPAVITYHSPGQTCPQNQLLYNGHTPCDGEVQLARCTSCRLISNNVPFLLSRISAFSEWPSLDPWNQSRFTRVLTARKMTRLFRESLEEFINHADCIVVLAEWCRKVWLLNNCPPSKIHLIRTAGPPPTLHPSPLRYPDRKIFRIVCLGRCIWVKGFHVLVDAVKLLPDDAQMEVHFLGPYWSDAYGQKLLLQMQGDSRFLPPQMVPNTELPNILSTMDVAVVPSLWLETGPLTVFDAFAAGLPVIGSRLGGIAELVNDQENGLLFPPGDSKILAEYLAQLMSNPTILNQLRKGISKKQRTMENVAEEMEALYTQLIK